ncbi:MULTISPECIES: endopeptidase La [Pseudomonas]|uniref:Lon protease n=1 Tax=Pseudomonas nitroreducens TaxID=46680 RepID=A0A6G6IVM0_PSENT|nr:MULTISPECIES: endopeptidase La [Pseudomonas]MCJ1877612.1 endopeptidase La [Pseudomonas nitroreducens]MCJ1895211.1 endopeptidase La [Pseudomonas nitroreducens]MDG9855679.1 endopeptidase La [Pseudomonas nitroreducens]MDH1075605.1 endopeptidase La [Pseudomonas nitroreducens]NMZ62412.1 endopeptidase La [Pseudomonas nitroreducens]
MKTLVELPLLPLRDVVVYPHMVIPLFVGREKSIEALEAAMTGDKQILLLAQKNPADDDPGADGLYRMGTVATVLQLLKLPDGTVKVLVEGEQRGQVERFIDEDAYCRAEVSIIDEVSVGERESEVFTRSLLSQFEQYVQLGKKVPAEVLSSLNSIDEPGRLVDTMAAHMALKIEQKQEILEITELSARVEHVLAMLDAEIDLLQVEKRIRGRVKKQMERSQREYYLNEQMKAIQKELGDIDEGHNEVEELKKRIDAAGLTKEALAKATAELNKLKQMSPMSAEATVVRSYIDWLVNVPWKAESKVRHDLDKAEDILDADHYGLEEVKERILEYLAVQKRVKKLKGPVLCLVGPPGVGKTSLAESIARATNRKFVRMALGGVRDEAEIRGHRRTYIGSMPGRLIQKMTKVGVRNPLFLLDEIDKMGSDMRGDPASALLEVLDPEQNHNFNDHYLEVDYDLSDVMFLCTANSMNIPAPLLDRMEVIRLPGYTEDEKINIASKYLVPKQTAANGLKKGELVFEEAATRDIIRYYTREAGVRSLERQIAKVCRKAVKDGGKAKRIDAVVTPDSLENYLGVRKFRYGLAEQQDQIGQVTGLAWTQVGGELLTIESAMVPGKGALTKTGSLGDVMAESITAALTVVRSRSKSLGIAPDFHEKHDIHIHVPEGATPKDGPSAGIGMCTALVSAITQIPVRADVAMTGEITLRGQVLAIGGLKEKLLAAHRGGIKTVIIPEENVRDLREIPDNIKADLVIKPVKWIDEVLQIALQYAPEPLPDAAPEMVAKDEKRESDSKERISTH